jgi:hypothetical protein
MMRWFGPSWGAPINRHCKQAPTPIDDLCARCEAPIADGDQGVMMPLITMDGVGMIAYHLGCFLESVGVPSSEPIPSAVDRWCGKPTIHCLLEGRALCAFHRGKPPSAWPAGHKWISVEDWPPPTGACPICAQVGTVEGVIPAEPEMDPVGESGKRALDRSAGKLHPLPLGEGEEGPEYP